MRRKLKFITAYLLMFLLIAGSGFSFNAGTLFEPMSVYAGESSVTAPAFDEMEQYDINAGGQSIAKGDFNSDKILDLILTHENTNTFSCSLGKTDGTFEPAKKTDSINYASSPCPGDFNEDGNLDLAVVSGQTHSLHIHLGNGDGTFQPEKPYSVGTSPNCIVSSDFNGDGHLDLAVSNPHSDNISILIGEGDGTYDNKTNIPAGSDPAYLAVKDFNGDGKDDIVVVNNDYSNKSFCVLQNGCTLGSVAFNTGMAYSLIGQQPGGSTIDMGPVIAADLVAGDGIADLATTVCLKGSDYGYDSYLFIYKGLGHGTFELNYSKIVGKQAYSLALGDFNSDGKPDVAMTNRMNSAVSILCKAGDSWQLFANYPAGSTPTQIITGDFNMDGADDLAAANPDYKKGLTVLIQKYFNDDEKCKLGCGMPVTDGGYSSFDLIDGEKYYHVNNEMQLAHIKDHMDKNFTQINDIKLKGNWIPIGGFTFEGEGRSENVFRGTYLGNSYKIENMSFSFSGDRDDGNVVAGLFSLVNWDAHIEGVNLYIGDVDLSLLDKGSTASDSTRSQILAFGGIAGIQGVDARETIQDCNVVYSENIGAFNQLGGTYVGGIAGINGGNIKDCTTNTVLLESEEPKIVVAAAPGTLGGEKVGGEASVGGICGLNVGNIENCDHNGALDVLADDYLITDQIFVGGISGCVDSKMIGRDASVKNCQNKGKISCKNPTGEEPDTRAYAGVDFDTRAYAGGIVGFMRQDSDEMSGKMSASEGSMAKITVLNCANNNASEIKAQATFAVAGGIAGGSDLIGAARPTIKNCYNWSNIISCCEGYGAASGGIVGATGRIEILTSYSNAKNVIYEIAADTEPMAAVNEIYDVSPDTEIAPCFGGGIAGLVWEPSFIKSFYEKSDSVTIGVGGKIADRAVALKADAIPDNIRADYWIIPYESDPDGVIGASDSELKLQSAFGTDEWKWYTTGGSKPQFYVEDEPWRFLGTDTYPVLRGDINTQPPDDTGHNHSSNAPEELTVTFKANDDTDKTVVQKPVKKNGTVSLPDEPDRMGYTFIGWNDEKSGDGYTFTAMTKVAKSLEVYAQWEKNENVETPLTSKYFTDMGGAKWAIYNIDLLHEKDVVYGVGGNLFKPNVNITRADFMSMLVRAYGLNVEFDDNFADVAKGKYYYEAVGIAKELGIAKGDGALFRPNDPITRQEAMTLAQRTLDTIGFSLDPGSESDLAKFADAASVASYARIPVATMIKSDIVIGEDGRILPLDQTTRAEMAVILYRMLNLQ